MSCIPFSVAAGRFSVGTGTVTPTTAISPVGGKTVRRTSSGVEVAGPGGMFTHSAAAVDYSDSQATPSHYMFGGSNNTLLLLDGKKDTTGHHRLAPTSPRRSTRSGTVEPTAWSSTRSAARARSRSRARHFRSARWSIVRCS
jgi:hypothetical protein